MISFFVVRPNNKDTVVVYDSDSFTDAYCDNSGEDYEPEYEFQQVCLSHLLHFHQRQTIGQPAR